MSEYCVTTVETTGDLTLPPAVRTLLLVDAQDSTRFMTKWFLESFGYVVQCARTAEEGLSIFDQKVHDVVITENLMPGMTGPELAHIIMLRSPKTPVVSYAQSTPKDTSCLKGVIAKPTGLAMLKETLERVFSESYQGS